MLVLDTDHLSEFERGSTAGDALRARLNNSPIGSVATIISAEEQLRGWLSRIYGCAPCTIRSPLTRSSKRGSRSMRNGRCCRGPLELPTVSLRSVRPVSASAQGPQNCRHRARTRRHGAVAEPRGFSAGARVEGRELALNWPVAGPRRRLLI